MVIKMAGVVSQVVPAAQEQNKQAQICLLGGSQMFDVIRVPNVFHWQVGSVVQILISEAQLDEQHRMQ